jgi:hypothetical protein
VPCARITRPLAQRIDWLLARLDTDDRDFAETEIRRSDRAHAARMHEQFGVSWGDPLLYDLVLNTGRLSVETCVLQIRALIGRPEFAETAQSRALLQSLALQARVRSALKANAATHDVNIMIDSADARLTLSGIVVTADERSAAADVAAAVRGVAGVDNQLRVMGSSRLFTSSKTT